ncbi:hypothetical protein L6452_31016 [Arctium lappa]|uniref:Uncharacterized protein n=1 Tax=Arctium lappa TaxID=4217 RepID=A0ACB8ZJZ5_ARCLA|nr:hypothetical protein L6452_31016 [Arctium lappa]
MQKVIISQQEQIANLKKMVLKLVHKKKKTKFVLKKRNIDNDTSKKGETEAETSNQSNDGMEYKFEGEMGAKAEISREEETEVAAETFKN